MNKLFSVMKYLQRSQKTQLKNNMNQDLKNQCTAIAYILHIALPKEETEEMLLFIGENVQKALKIGNKQIEFCEYILNNNAHYTPLKNVENIAAYLDAFLKGM